MRFVVYGAGAVGGVLGARLALASYDVALVARGAHLDAILADGLTLRSVDGDQVVRLPAADTVADLSPSADTVVLLTVKGHQTAAALDDLVAHVPQDATIVCVQNGVANEAACLRRFPHVLAVTVMMPTTHLDPGVVVQNSSPVPGILDLGRFPTGRNERCELVSAAFRAAGFESVVRDDAMAWKHRKLLMNLGNAAQACFEPGDDRNAVVTLMREEGERVLAAAGTPVTSEADEEVRRGSLLTAGPVGSRSGGSTWQSLARGQGTVETDYLNGEIALLGRLHGVPTPANDLIRVVMAEQVRGGATPSTLPAAGLLTRL
ncbi:2-dehydropantoate 2-reductase N-terminal domain-containing protein [Nocardioides sp. InS609-2]|uniref:ketopantoate reductase family protein n=1 Tax=Nocardioides sp. InS609-2 TaxID=2760705 RepID=UPI0020C0A4F0|nr:2-dehydropantoate 2-reductase N-terminal domain-containing protein [Nocardioides sp. InS609-2]